MHPNFQAQFTHINLPSPPQLVQMQDSVLFIGSCFGQNMHQKLSDLGFNSYYSPFGVVFNPYSIAQQLLSLQQAIEPLHFHLNQYFSFNHHHLLSGTNQEQLQQKIAELKHQFGQNLKTANQVFISLGSAWVYTHNQTIVANCHKLPQNQFHKRLLSEQEIIQSLETIVNTIIGYNPQVQITFTISPVKHLRDGIVENSISKAKLISALHSFLEKQKQCHYFAAYEIVNCHLRDYRYYANDLMHPSMWTIDYIYTRWLQTYFSPQAQDLLAALSKLQKLKNHKLMDLQGAENHSNAISELKALIAKQFNFNIE